MDNISTQISDLNDIKLDLSTAIGSKYNVFQGTFRDYPSKLLNIPNGAFRWPNGVQLQYSSSSAYPNWKYLYTGETTDMSHLYEECYGDSSGRIDLTGMVVKNVTTMESMFQDAHNVSSIILPDGFGRQCGNVTTMAHMLRGCQDLTALPEGLKNLDCSSCTDITSMFMDCGIPGTLDLSGWRNMGNVTTMAHTFNEDAITSGGRQNGATTINLSGWDVTSIDTIEGMFYNNRVVENINMSWTTTSSCTNIVGLFIGCTNLKSVDMSGCDFSNAGMWRTFYQCSKLESIYITNQGTLNKLTNNLRNSYTGSGTSYADYIPRSATIYYNDSQYKWQNNQWTLQ